MSPRLFTMVLKYAFKKFDWSCRGISVDGEKLNNLRFADDIVFITEDLGEAEEMLDELASATREIGLQINKNKTKFMTNLVFGGTMRLEDNNIEEVAQYRYFEHDIKISRDNQTQEMQRRMGSVR